MSTKASAGSAGGRAGNRPGPGGPAQSNPAQSSPAQSNPAQSSPAQGGLKPDAGASSHPARSVLLELADLLEAERGALVSLDRGAIEGFANRKLELDEALRRAVGEAKLGATEQALLDRVRQSALSNQLLLAHARSCVEGVLSLLTPANTPRYTAPGHAQNAHAGSPAPPIALNLRR